MQKITQLDLFSGIGGFHLGFERAGYEVKSYFSEIDKHAVAVYKQQFKNAEYVGSVTDVRGAELPTIDLITFGSPCQDFSLAGKRKGMQGDRSSLVLEAIRLINECRPSVFIWENVKGTFSSNNGADFWAIIQAFANIGGYRLEWQLLNTSWVLPQNRERVYLVGYSTTPGGDWRGVFPIGEGNGENDSKLKIYGDTNKGGQKGVIYDPSGVAGCLSATDYKQPKQIAVKSAISKGAVVQPVQIGQSSQTFAAKSGTLIGKEGQDAFTIRSSNPNGVKDQSYRIRRLTPIECERLQGFPDNHTEYGNYDGEVNKMSNTQRYKQCGNAVTVDIVALVAEAVKPILNRTV
jgi:DNA (cytosine-5)-methyltransferase 1